LVASVIDDRLKLAYYKFTLVSYIFTIVNL
jgi:hypothetical protein